VGTELSQIKDHPYYATDLGVARPERVDVGREPVCGVDPYRPTVVGLEASVYDLCDRLPCGNQKRARSKQAMSGGKGKGEGIKAHSKGTSPTNSRSLWYGTYQRGGLLEKLVEEVKADLATFDAQLADAKEHE
jgi:hypothetical protein